MGYTPLINQNFALIFALVFTIIGISAILWLTFFVNHGRELPRKDKITGTTIRLLTMSISLGLAFHFWSLIEIF